jgi:hypothetical protein
MKIRFVLVALAAHVRAASHAPEALAAHTRREVALWKKVTRDAALPQH